MKQKVIEYCEPCDVVCPICGTRVDLSMLYNGIDLDHPVNPLGSCSHLVTFAPGFDIAGELASFCDEMNDWNRLFRSLPGHLTDHLYGSEDDLPEKDPLGDYFIRHFVAPCSAFARLDYYYQTAGGMGTSGVVTTPFVWTTDKTALADQMRLKLRSAVKRESLKRKPRKVGG